MFFFKWKEIDKNVVVKFQPVVVVMKYSKRFIELWKIVKIVEVFAA